MWRIYYFDKRMNNVEVEDCIWSKRRAAARARARVKREGWYTYAIGALS